MLFRFLRKSPLTPCVLCLKWPSQVTLCSILLLYFSSLQVPLAIIIYITYYVSSTRTCALWGQGPTSSVHFTAVSPSIVPIFNRCMVSISSVNEWMNQPRIPLPSTREEPLAECRKEVLPGSGRSLPFFSMDVLALTAKGKAGLSSSHVSFQTTSCCWEKPLSVTFTCDHCYTLLESLFLLEFE